MNQRLVFVLIPAFFAVTETYGHAESALEPFVYSEDFETRSLRAWESYPLWQDTAYDPNFRVNEIIKGDPNISIVQLVTPYSNVDNYAGAQKLFDIYFVPGSTINFRYYLKTHLPVEFIKVRLAAGNHDSVDYTIPNPPTNRWEWVTVTFEDFVSSAINLTGISRLKVNALAVLAKVPDADPAMPLYLGLDDVSIKAMRVKAFQFIEPQIYKLSEFKPYVCRKHYSGGDEFSLKGRWSLDAERVLFTIVSFTDRTKSIVSKELKRDGAMLYLEPLTLTFPEGMYLGTLKAYHGNEKISDTEFSFIIAPRNLRGKHPRLFFDSTKQKIIEARLRADKYQKIYEEIASQAKSWREKYPLDKAVYVADQFPDENWLPSFSGWYNRSISSWSEATKWNALAYTFHGDRTAGEYVVKLLSTISTFPDWNHPWMAKRGRYNYHPNGVMAHNFALAYDLTYDLMSEDERRQIRRAFMEKLVLGSFRTYVEDDMVTCDTSNWLSHIVGGSSMLVAAMYGDGDEEVEPYFSGNLFKLYDFITHTFLHDGSYGEGYGYNSYTMLTLAESLPALENVMKIDMSGPVNGSYQETIWAGIIKEKKNYYFGDSSGSVGPLTNWALLLPKYKDPLLGWLYHYTKQGETFMDVLYDTFNVPRDEPFDEKPVRVFRDVGTTVFKSGWEPDDFVFVFRTGPFFNHQHLDQGTFWLSDRGSLFIEERHGSTYYDDPLYQPWYTQPVSHSTILINRNHHGQRVGDHKVFAEGFDDYAFIGHFLDGEHAAFVSGDIGRLYWGTVRSIVRNVLYIKPRTLLMLDTIVPAEKDVDVTLLFQAKYLKDIAAGSERSTITKDGNILSLYHLYPDHVVAEAVETPIYLNTLTSVKPLEKEGMLTVTSRTEGVPLVMANLITTALEGSALPEIREGKGFKSWIINDVDFIFSTKPGSVYECNDIKSDACAIARNDSLLFAALCTTMYVNSYVVIESSEPLTFECDISGLTSIKYYSSKESNVVIGCQFHPQKVSMNGKPVKEYDYDYTRKALIVSIPAGEGTLSLVSIL